MRHAAAALAVVAVALLLAGCSEDLAPRAMRGPTQIELGHGATSVFVFLPAGPPTPRPPGVVFLHGWGATEPGTYGTWIGHLVAEGNEVVYPRYQVGPISLPSRALPSATQALRAALRFAPVAPHGLVFAGHSAGAALSADLAVTARSAGLPQPDAVFAVYPGRKLPHIPFQLPEQDLAKIPAQTWVVALGGAHDETVGTGPAIAMVKDATGVPAAHRAYELVTAATVSVHRGPLLATAAARRAFWGPLDTLIASRRAGG